MINDRIDKIDLGWSEIGDLTLRRGDFKDTSDKFGKAFIQEIRSRIGHTAGTWRTNPNIGSNIDEFEGQPNTPLTGDRIRADINFALTKDSFLDISEFEVIPVPVSRSEILVRVQFKGILTEQLPDSTINLNIIFDLTGKGPYIVN